MYEVPRYYITNGNSVNEETRRLMSNIKNGIDVQQSKDDLFRLTYPMALTELKRYTNMGPLEELISYMSIAFIKTVQYYNPDASSVSFMNYYKRAIHSEVIIGMNGRYRSNPQLKRDFEANLGSLEHPIYDKDQKETATLQDTIADEYWDGYFDRDIDYKCLVDDVRTCMNDILYKKQKGRRIRTTVSDSKKAFEHWIEAMIEERENFTQAELGEQIGLGRSAVNNAISKYMPKFKEELKNMGY